MCTSALGFDVLDGHEAVVAADVGAAAYQLAKETVGRSHHLIIPIIPCSVTFFASACTISPI